MHDVVRFHDATLCMRSIVYATTLIDVFYKQQKQTETKTLA